MHMHSRRHSRNAPHMKDHGLLFALSLSHHHVELPLQPLDLFFIPTRSFLRPRLAAAIHVRLPLPGQTDPGNDPTRQQSPSGISQQGFCAFEGADGRHPCTLGVGEFPAACRNLLPQLGLGRHPLHSIRVCLVDALEQALALRRGHCFADAGSDHRARKGAAWGRAVPLCVRFRPE